MLIGILGAGYSGLYAAKHFTSNPNFQVIVLEQQKAVGGTWCYTKKVGSDAYGLPIHPSMYDNLRTHIPRQLMGFPEMPFPHSKGKPTYPHHTEVLKYLNDFAERFDLKKYIQFGMAVTEIKRLETDVGDPRWQVTCLNLNGDPSVRLEESFVFDKLVLCTGNHALSEKPEVVGLASFPGLTLHSHDYRNNAPFRGQTVLVAGAGLSGVDIGQEIGQVAQRVILVNPRNTQLANCGTTKPIIEEAGYVSHVDGRTVHLTNGHHFSVDAIIFCTGYRMSDHLFHPNCEVTYHHRRLMPFYKFLVHAKYPSLAVVGILSKIIPSVAPRAQVRFLKRLFEGHFRLPTEAEMVADADAEFQRRLAQGLAPHYAHFFFGRRQFRYVEELNAVAGLPSDIPPVVEEALMFSLDFAVQDPERYRETGVALLDDRNYQLYPESKKVLAAFPVSRL